MILHLNRIYFGLVFAFSLAVVFGCSDDGRKKSTHNDFDLNMNADDTLTININLEIVDIGSNSNYPVGLGLRYQVANNSSQKVFIIFEPMFLVALKDGYTDFFTKRDESIEAIVPPEIKLRIDSSQCIDKPKGWLLKSIYDSLNIDSDGSEKLNAELFSESFLFLDPYETYECSHSITGLLYKNETFVDKGRYEFYYVYDGKQDILYRNTIPNEFYGYRRIRRKIISNKIRFSIK